MAAMGSPCAVLNTPRPLPRPHNPLPGDSSLCTVHRSPLSRALALSSATSRSPLSSAAASGNGGDGGERTEISEETQLYSLAPFPLLFAAALPGAGIVRSVFRPFVEVVKSLNLPDWLVHWGHPGNMAVVLFAMGGYGTYLGFRIRFFDNLEEKAMAKDLHPKLLAGMFFFFALGATGGVTSLLTSDKPILESPHAVTGFVGLALLTVQTILSALFEVVGATPNLESFQRRICGQLLHAAVFFSGQSR